MKDALSEIKKILKANDTDNATAIKKIAKIISDGEKPDFSEINEGDRFKYKGIEFVALEYRSTADGVHLLAVVANIWKKLPFDKDGCNDWRKSSLREILNTEFLSLLDKDDLVLEEFDLIADNGEKDYGTSKDYIGLLSCDDFREYRDILPKYGNWYWTLTPWSCNPSDASDVRGVYTDGTLCNSRASNAFSVVPACVFRIE